MIHGMLHFTAKETESAGEFLKRQGFGKNNAFYLIKHGCVLCSGKPVRDKDEIISKGAFVTVRLLEEKTSVIPAEGPLKILYEDEYLLILDKPAGINTEPSMSDYTGSLSNFVAAYYLAKCIKSGIHPVGRLDRVTSGIVIFAKNRYIHHLMAKTAIEKEYSATVTGKVASGTIKVTLEKDPETGKRIPSSSGKACITEYSVISEENGFTKVLIKPKTGRTHQIRASFAAIGHPLSGDVMYGGSGGPFDLKAFSVSFVHPVTGRITDISI